MATIGASPMSSAARTPSRSSPQSTSTCPLPGSYEPVKNSDALTSRRIAQAFNIPQEAVYGIFFVDAIDAVKVTIFKYNGGQYVGQGDPDNMDIFGCQQYIPMLGIEIDSEPA